jgi:hypothetical protein
MWHTGCNLVNLNKGRLQRKLILLRYIEKQEASYARLDELLEQEEHLEDEMFDKFFTMLVA